jgi:4-amino-4-deoxy-L-arabinose transferase-like glycosyltransferase
MDAISKPLRLFLIVMILLVAALLRFTGLNWDLAQWIHPDEGHMRAVVGAIALPARPGLYFDTHASPLNPRNNGQIYSYGTLPLFATRAVTAWLDRGCGADPAPVNAWVAQRVLARLGVPRGAGGTCAPGTFSWTYNAFVGRHLAALADLGTVLLIYLLARRLYGEAVGLLAMGFGALTAFMIQQAHFFTVDSAAAFFTVLTAWFAVRAGEAPGADGARGSVPWLDLGLAGLATGLAAASKVSAAVAALLVALAGARWVWRRVSHQLQIADPAADTAPTPFRRVVKAALTIAPPLMVAALLSLVAFRVGQPYAFEGPGFFGLRRSPEWFGRLARIGEEQSGMLDYPSGRQWTNRLPVIFPWVNMVVWGMGLPLGLVAWAGWALTGVELAGAVLGAGGDPGRQRHVVLWSWATLFFGFYATRWVKAMRYFLPLYPLLAIFAAYLLVRLVTRGGRWQRWGLVVTALVVVGTAVWGSALFGIYLRPHTRVAASRWIYANVPAGAVVANEHWDWGLPLRIEGRNPFGGTYTGIEMQNYNEDTPEKLVQLVGWLDQADYIFLASNRLYGSIPRLPERYPLTTTYYRALFAGELGFELVADFTSYPAAGPFVFPDQENPFPLMTPDMAPQGDLLPVPLPPAEESFSVYDHPRVLIFRKSAGYSHRNVVEVLGRVDVAGVEVGQHPREVTPRVVLIAHNPWLYVGLGMAVMGALAWWGRRGRLRR